MVSTSWLYSTFGIKSATLVAIAPWLIGAALVGVVVKRQSTKNREREHAYQAEIARLQTAVERQAKDAEAPVVPDTPDPQAKAEIQTNVADSPKISLLQKILHTNIKLQRPKPTVSF